MSSLPLPSVGTRSVWTSCMAKSKAARWEPLDGQQRLTTLFLLHWYVAVHAGTLTDDAPWTRFSYSTRPTAVLFCKELVRFPPPPNVGVPSEWIRNRPWYLHAWRHDPTIQSMLVMLDAIHAKFRERSVDFSQVWQRLTDTASPAISFLFLPIGDMGSSEDLYIKMNSRGKPLTRFENFKARFEKALEGSTRRDELIAKIDGEWADVLWRLDGGDYTIDDQFIHYLEFIIEICEWRSGTTRQGRLDERAQRVFGGTESAAISNLEFLFHAFDGSSQYVPGQKPEKGFLALDAELEVAADFGVGVHLNWGRSCLEARDPSWVASEVAAARTRDLLTGVVFSGVSSTATRFGPAWADAHLPATPDEPASLLTQQAIADCARIAVGAGQAGHPAAYLGAKVSAASGDSVEHRVQLIRTVFESATGTGVTGR